jgi:hypothetical protein
MVILATGASAYEKERYRPGTLSQTARDSNASG